MTEQINVQLQGFDVIGEDILCNVRGGQAKDIAGNLKVLRQEAGLSRNQLAQTLMVDPTAITHWEHGRRVPDIDTLIQIAEIYDKTLDSLVQDAAENAGDSL